MSNEITQRSVNIKLILWINGVQNSSTRVDIVKRGISSPCHTFCKPMQWVSESVNSLRQLYFSSSLFVSDQASVTFFNRTPIRKKMQTSWMFAGLLPAKVDLPTPCRFWRITAVTYRVSKLTKYTRGHRFQWERARPTSDRTEKNYRRKRFVNSGTVAHESDSNTSQKNFYMCVCVSYIYVFILRALRKIF